MTTTLRSLVLLAIGVAGCGLVENEIKNLTTVDYAVPPQEMKEDFGAPAAGNLPMVACSGDADCTKLPAVQGATPSCSGGQCILTVTVRTTIPVDLTKQGGFVAAVGNSPAVDHVDVKSVSYWAPTNTLTVDTPPVQVYVGPSTIKTETDPNATLLGTIPPLPRGQTVPMNQPMQMSLTPAGQAALSMLAKSFQTPLGLLAVAKVVVHGGQPVPGGAIDLFVQPTLTFALIK